MALPKQREVEFPLIREIFQNGGRLELHAAYRNLANFFQLTQTDLLEVHPSDNRSIWENRVRQVERHLKDLGVLTSYSGILEITEKGNEIAKLISNLKFNKEELAKLVGKKALTVRKEMYENLIANGIDKCQALKIVGVNDCKTLLEILEEV